jgi:hypothetical protein
MKIFGWAADDQACGYYRLQLPLNELAKRGHETLVNGLMPQQWRETADIIIAQRTCLPKPTVRWQQLAAEGRAALVYDIDDNLFELDPGNDAGLLFNRPEIRANIQRNIEVAHLVTVSTPGLAEVVSKYNSNVAVLPNTIDQHLVGQVTLPERDPDQPENPLIIGWGGSPTHGLDWLEVRDHLIQVVHRRKQVRVRFLGTDYSEGLPKRRVDVLGWTRVFAEHYANIAQFTIGLGPLANTAFNHSKSWLRPLECAAVGVPIIASALPEYERFVDDRQTGLIVRNPGHWRHLLLELIDDPAARRDMSVIARARATEWTIQAKADLWERAYQALLNKREVDNEVRADRAGASERLDRS